MSRISGFHDFGVFLTILAKIDYSGHFDHFCESPASPPVEKDTFRGSGQTRENDPFDENDQNTTFDEKRQNTTFLWFWPKHHFWRFWPKRIIAAILTLFAKNQPLLRSKSDVLLGQAENVKK